MIVHLPDGIGCQFLVRRIVDGVLGTDGDVGVRYAQGSERIAVIGHEGERRGRTAVDDLHMLIMPVEIDHKGSQVRQMLIEQPVPAAGL